MRKASALSSAIFNRPGYHLCAAPRVSIIDAITVRAIDKRMIRAFTGHLLEHRPSVIGDRAVCGASPAL